MRTHIRRENLTLDVSLKENMLTLEVRFKFNPFFNHHIYKELSCHISHFGLIFIMMKDFTQKGFCDQILQLAVCFFIYKKNKIIILNTQISPLSRGYWHCCLKPTDPRYYLEADLSIYDAPLGALNHI